MIHVWFKDTFIVFLCKTVIQNISFCVNKNLFGFGRTSGGANDSFLNELNALTNVLNFCARVSPTACCLAVFDTSFSILAQQIFFHKQMLGNALSHFSMIQLISFTVVCPGKGNVTVPSSKTWVKYDSGQMVQLNISEGLWSGLPCVNLIL